MEDFLPTMAELLEVEEVHLEDTFSSFDSWDSLIILSVIAFCSDNYKVVLTAYEIAELNTIQQLKELIESRI